MIRVPENWVQTLTQLTALAGRLEREGQYNVAKLAWAAADALIRRAAYAVDLPPDKPILAQETEALAASLAVLGVGEDLPAPLRRGAAGLRDGRFTLIDETPNASVCRTCGNAVVGQPVFPCPICGARASTRDLAR